MKKELYIEFVGVTFGLMGFIFSLSCLSYMKEQKKEICELKNKMAELSKRL